MRVLFMLFVVFSLSLGSVEGKVYKYWDDSSHSKYTVIAEWCKLDEEVCISITKDLSRVKFVPYTITVVMAYPFGVETGISYFRILNFSKKHHKVFNFKVRNVSKGERGLAFAVVMPDSMLETFIKADSSFFGIGTTVFKNPVIYRIEKSFVTDMKKMRKIILYKKKEGFK